MTLRILCDDNIFGAERCFAGLGEVRLRPGREIGPADAARADVLLVRSQTRVDAALLEQAAPVFVGTATVGTDHVDLAELARRGIPFANAPGSNAEAVADWVMAAVAVAVVGGRLEPGTDFRAGVVGAGQIGTRVARRLAALGAEVLICDPPRARRGDAVDDLPFVDLDDTLDCDLLTLHVPLERAGTDPTLHLLDAARVAGLRPQTLLLHAARGGVVDDAALAARAAGGMAVAVDTWEGEPHLRRDLLDTSLLATPHIAGHSVDGKARGTLMLHAALCAALGLDREPPVLTPPAPAPIELSVPAGADVGLGSALLWNALLRAWDPRRDDADLRRVIADQEAGGFDRLRRNYPPRRDLEACSVRLLGPGDLAGLAHRLSALGFGRVDTGAGAR